MVAIITFLSVLVWLFLGYVGVRILTYESIYFWQYKQTPWRWIVRLFQILPGPFTLVLSWCIAENENIARGMWRYHKRNQPSRFTDIMNIVGGKFFGIKEY